MADAARDLVVAAPGGRELAVQDRGPRDAPVVLSHHGMPSCRLDVPGGSAAPDVLGVRVVTFDRPGYGGSTPLPGRRVADAAEDARAIMDALGVERFGVIGTSGGGPHALATAAGLGDRVTRACVCVGCGPIGREDFDILADALPATRREVELARSDTDGLRRYIEDVGGATSDFAVWFEHLPPWDREVLSRPHVAADERAVAEELARGGIEGWFGDDLALFARAWDVDLAAIETPTLLLFGGADVLVPSSHGEAYTRVLPNASLVVVDGGGHWLIDEQREALLWLAGLPSAVTTPHLLETRP